MSNLIVSLLLLSIVQIHCHNWVVDGISRASHASLARWPAPPKTTPLPHVQVGPGQRFALEWATGHGDLSPERRGKTYFALVSASSAKEELLKMTNNAFQAYEAEAPVDVKDAGFQMAQDPQFSKKHRHPLPGTVDLVYRGGLAEKFDDVPNFYSKVLAPGDDEYFDRPALFGAANAMVSYKSPEREEDYILEYSNPNFPVILKQWCFQIHFHQPGEYDTATFELPDNLAPGDYFLLYNWKSYYDVIDVNVLASPAPAVYGGEPLDGGEVWIRIDHCWFPDPRIYHGPACQLVQDNDDLTDCFARFNGKSYHSLQLTPLKIPYGPFRDDPDSLLVETREDTTARSTYRNCGQYANVSVPFPDVPDDGSRENSFLCIPVTSRFPDSVVGEYETTDDPEDPAFYSTCFIRKPARLFEGFSDFVVEPPQSRFYFEDRCLDCQVYEKYGSLPIEKVPVWRFTDRNDCVDCDNGLTA